MQTRNYILMASFLTLVFWPGNIFAQNNDLSKALPIDILNKIPSDLSLTINENSYPLAKSEISTWLKEKNYLSCDAIYFSEIENIDLCKYEKSIECRLSFPYEKQRHVRKNHTLSVNIISIENFTKDLARKVNKDPIDAKFEITDGKVSVFSLSSPGIELNEKESVKILENYLLAQNFSSSPELPTQKKQPEISSDSQNNLGITSLIGSGKSNFVGSPKNRIFNIKVATNRFNGILIKPDEEFSFVKVLGEVDGEHGYLPELVIKQDKTEPEFGGGICQVSTTAFRAAINSGLEITARRNHAYPVSYYNPQGMDATVYVPRPDLRFINNTPKHILIETKIEGTELFFNFYGTDDGRKTNVIGPTITERKPDGSMKATFTQQVFDKDAKLIREDVFNSAYDSPSKYPHPGAETLTEKPKDWSDNEWKKYKKEHKI
ncbi:MAG: VanW family protein [Candidatus Moraniibacteriota bacterium]